MWEFLDGLHSEQLLRNVDQLAAWNALIMPTTVSMYQKFKNPFRFDRKPGCFLSPSFKNADRIILNDYGKGRTSYHGWDILRAVRAKRNISHAEACNAVLKFKNNRSTTKYVPTTRTPVEKCTIEFIKRHFNVADRDFWQPLGIEPRHLMEDKVYPVARYRMNSKFSPILKVFEPNSVCYAICMPSGNIKLYQPYETDFKWISNTSVQDVGNFDPLRTGDTLIITKSYKDHRILRNLGFDAVWTQNEGCIIPDDIARRLDYCYDNIYVLYDNDEAGLKAADKLVYNTSWQAFTFDEKDGKDCAEFVVKHNLKDLQSFIDSSIDHLYLPF